MYKNNLPPRAYDHTFHAGNVGDVWKHFALLEFLTEMQRRSSSVHCVDCYAGSGSYSLQVTGEWTEGIGRLADFAHERHLRIENFISKVFTQRGKERVYRGSPLLMQEKLRPTDLLSCFEVEEGACARLRSAVTDQVTVSSQSGLTGLREIIDSELQRKVFALIDPPWVEKEDWITIPKFLIEMARINPSGTYLLWYPIKSYTRVNAMFKLLEENGVHGVALDLITTPLEFRRNRLNGSGMLVVGDMSESFEALSSIAPVIGSRCAAKDSAVKSGYWKYEIKTI